MRRPTLCILAVLLASASLAACGSPPATGVVQGIFKGMGSSTRVGGVPSSGQLFLTSAARSYEVTAASDGAFSISLPPGTYHIVGWDLGESHQGTSSCQSSVTVTEGDTSHVTVRCVFHGMPARTSTVAVTSPLPRSARPASGGRKSMA